MANKKISGFDDVKKTGTDADVTFVSGFAAYGTNDQGTPDVNVQLSGNELITSLEKELDLAKFQTGILPVSRGGTGLQSITTLQNANVDYSTDGSGVLPVNNWLPAGGAQNQYIDYQGNWQTFSTGTTYQAGDGIEIDTATTPDTIKVDIKADSGLIIDNTSGDPELSINLSASNMQGVLNAKDGGTGVGGLTDENVVIGGGPNTALGTVLSKGKGRIIVGKTTTTFGDQTTSISVGTDGQVLTADSTLDEGVKWADAATNTYNLKGEASAQDPNIYLREGTPPTIQDTINFSGAGSTTVESDVNGNITISSTGGGSPTGFTEKDNSTNPQDEIDWDITTDGPNLIVTTGAGVKNTLVISSYTGWQDGQEGWVYFELAQNNSYRLPEEGQGSVTGLVSKTAGGNPFSAGTNPTLFRYVYDATDTTLLWIKDENFTTPTYPADPDFDTSDLLIFITPENFNQANQGTITGSATFENLVPNTIFGNMSGPSSPSSGYEFYPRNNATYGAAYWSMGGTGTVGIFRVNDLSVNAALGAELTYQGYIQGPYFTGYETLVDFDGVTNAGAYEQHLYIYSASTPNQIFRLYAPNYDFGYPPLLDYSSSGGANLREDWLFVSFGITPGANGTATLRVATQSSLTWAQNNPPATQGGTTDWDFQNGDGTGDTVAVDANGIYTEVFTGNLTEATITNINIGRNYANSEFGRFHYGLFGIYEKDVNLADTAQNWIDSRGIYGIS